MTGRHWLRVITISVLAGTIAASAITFLDWRLNPGGIFRDTQGTDWTVVAETALSWYWPVTVLVFLVGVATVFLFARPR